MKNVKKMIQAGLKKFTVITILGVFLMTSLIPVSAATKVSKIKWSAYRKTMYVGNAQRFATRTTDCISLAEWSLGPLSIFLDGAAGLLFIRLFMRLSHFHGRIVRFLEAVGRRSLHIFCIHTVEIIAIPWYLMVARFSDRPVLGMWLQYAIALGSIWLVCELLRARRALIIRFFPARRKSPAVHYTARH